MEKLKVVFVPRRSRIRPYKIAKALKYTGKVHLVLVCEESFYEPQFVEGIFDEVHYFTKKNFLFNLPKAEKIYRRLNEIFGFGFKKLKRIIQEVNPDLVHCFAEPYNHIEFILKNIDCPVIMSDGADFTGITVGIENLPERIRKQEQYCFENVQGLVHKGPSFEIEYYSKYYDINFKDLSFLDYCDDNLIVDPDIRENNEIHIVYAGHVSEDFKNRYIYYVDLAKDFQEQRIHFHIYPNPYQYSSSIVYKKLSNELEYFHFHKPVSYAQLSKEISKYNWGLWYHDPSGGKRISPSKSRVAIGNKMFTYMEAGLPIIVGKHNGHGRLIIESERIGISVNRLDLKRIRSKLQDVHKESLDNLLAFRKTMILSDKGELLYKFYKTIVDE